METPSAVIETTRVGGRNDDSVAGLKTNNGILGMKRSRVIGAADSFGVLRCAQDDSSFGFVALRPAHDERILFFLPCFDEGPGFFEEREVFFVVCGFGVFDDDPLFHGSFAHSE